MELRFYPQRVERPAPPTPLTPSQAVHLGEHGPPGDHARAVAAPLARGPAQAPPQPAPPQPALPQLAPPQPSPTASSPATLPAPTRSWWRRLLSGRGRHRR
ncbi:MAG TPA: hypothetical protein VM324_10560 [Egibacteraceae bacterium]|nr:hypothetical protein [Egibacteraceae bacterium]